MQKRFPALVLWCCWLLIVLWQYRALLPLPPTGHHAWAMFDYYAMALRFSANGFDFLHPQTFNLRTLDGITASDLPLPAWLSAMGMALFGTESAGVFRVLTVAASGLGLYCFFLTLRHLGVSTWRAVCLALLMGSLPCWLYYACSMLPTPWAFAAVLIGFWALRRSLSASEGEWPWLVTAVAAFTMAALIRKPFVLHAAAAAVSWWVAVEKGSNRRSGALVWGLGAATWLGWQGYDYYLGQTYGSGFLRTLMMPTSAGEAWDLCQTALRKWGLLWCAPALLLWLPAAAALQRGTGGRTKGLIVFTGISAVAGIFYAVLFLRQFPDHDYYGIDAFYPALFASVAGLAAATEHPRRRFWVEAALLPVALLWLNAQSGTYWKAEHFTAQETTNRAYGSSRALLDSLGVPPNAKILVFEAYSDNGPLVGMRRQGYCLKSSKPAEVNPALDWPWDYAICTDTFWTSEVLRDNPDLGKHLQWAGGNAALSVFQRNQSGKPAPLESLTGRRWTALSDTTDMLPSSAEFLWSRSLAPQQGKQVLFYGFLRAEPAAPLKATVALFRHGQKVALVEAPLQANNTFQLAVLHIPHVEADELRVYCWNPEQKAVGADWFKVMVQASVDF